MTTYKTILVIAALMVSGTCPAHAQTPGSGKRRNKFELFPTPSLRVGDVFRVDFRVKLQADYLSFPDEIAPADTFLFGRRRLAVEGLLLKVFEYRVEREFRDRGAWTDVDVNYRRFEAAEVRAGKFKMPFSLEQSIGVFSQDFIYRSVIARDLAPARDTGVMVHGRLARRWLGYEAGVFQHDGNQAQFKDNPGANATLAWRLRALPWRARQDSVLQNLQLGFGMTSGIVPEGLNSLRARTIGGTSIYRRAYVNGRRVRLGSELSWMPGPFTVRSEFIQVREDRNGQGIGGTDLPRLGTSGWYVSGTWLLTGERKTNVPPPRASFLAGGAGAVEAAVRYERLRSGSDAPGEPEQDTARAANLVESRYGAWTLGINWYPNRWGKIQFNAVRESLEPPGRSLVANSPAYWSGVCRFQLVI